MTQKNKDAQSEAKTSTDVATQTENTAVELTEEQKSRAEQKEAMLKAMQAFKHTDTATLTEVTKGYFSFEEEKTYPAILTGICIANFPDDDGVVTEKEAVEFFDEGLSPQMSAAAVLVSTTKELQRKGFQFPLPVLIETSKKTKRSGGAGGYMQMRIYVR